MFSRIACFVLTATALVGGPEDPSAEPTVQQAAPVVEVAHLAWLSGSWVSSSGDRIAEEHWTPPAGNSMFAVSRTISGDRTVFFEFLRIEKTGDRIVYFAAPRGRHPPTPFTLVELDGERVVFENPDHDFPQRIIYWREGDVLNARIEGIRNGKHGGSQWSWKRAAVETD